MRSLAVAVAKGGTQPGPAFARLHVKITESRGRQQHGSATAPIGSLPPLMIRWPTGPVPTPRRHPPPLLVGHLLVGPAAGSAIRTGRRRERSVGSNLRWAGRRGSGTGSYHEVWPTTKTSPGGSGSCWSIPPGCVSRRCSVDSPSAAVATWLSLPAVRVGCWCGWTRRRRNGSWPRPTWRSPSWEDGLCGGGSGCPPSTWAPSGSWPRGFAGGSPSWKPPAEGVGLRPQRPDGSAPRVRLRADPRSGDGWARV